MSRIESLFTNTTDNEPVGKHNEYSSKHNEDDCLNRLQRSEVNPVEHLWEELREKYLQNRLFSSLDLLVEVLCQGLNELTDDEERIRSMMSFPHL